MAGEKVGRVSGRPLANRTDINLTITTDLLLHFVCLRLAGTHFLLNDPYLEFFAAGDVVVDLNNMLDFKKDSTKFYKTYGLWLEHPRREAKEITKVLEPFQAYSLKYGLSSSSTKVYEALEKPSYGK
eukprot:GHVT01089385.1.p1 GENE.GHVT01089385.1~~GHVT01089385.1.p1  ORF type:complete len:127 (+),score=0.40 GHVT01089385.1:1070-1450(+)